VQTCDEALLSGSDTQNSGSTAVVLLIRKGNADTPTTLYCANVGDSKAVLCRAGVAVELSYDHKPTRSDERQRIENAGGSVVKGRLFGVLGVSRSFGDKRFKSDAVRVAQCRARARS
jgi:serine/threonine protein phosphatase PrpC